jgi:hypothetical protein
MEKDVVICSYNCGGPMDCNAEAAKFSDPPHILWIPGGPGTSSFRNEAQRYSTEESILDRYLKKIPSSITPRRICLASFSAGWAFSTEIINKEKDRSRIDCAMVMDGIHTESLNGWESFSEMAGKGGKAPKLWLAHSQIKPPYVSTKITNTRIINYAKSVYGNNVNSILPIPDYIINPVIDKPIKIYSSIVNPKWKEFKSDTLVYHESVGNVSRFEYKGDYPQDHIYNAHYVQPRFWRWLKELWGDVNQGIFFK